MNESDHPDETGIRTTLKQQTTFLLGFLALLWAIAAADYILGGSLSAWGVQPRSITGAAGILFAPFLHGDFQHLAQNSIPLFVLGWLVFLHGPAEFAKATVAAALVGGAGTWVIGATQTMHLGSSVLIFGYFGYLALRGLFERSVKSILLSVVVIMIYGGMVFGVFPSHPGVSWQMHLFGAIGGGIAARPGKAKD